MIQWSLHLRRFDQHPRVSVVIPAYGRRQYLLDCVQAILDDGYPALDIVVIDDGSPENITAGLAERFRNSPVRFFREQNAGTAATRNKGAALALGEYLLMVDDDDLVLPGSIGWRVEALQSDASLSAVAGRCQFLSASGVPTGEESVNAPGLLMHWDILARNHFYSPGQLLLRRSSFDATPGFEAEFLGSDDWSLWIALARVGPLLVDERLTLGYRFHDGNFSRNVITMWRGALAVATRALSGVCDSHVDVARYLAFQFVSDVYREKLATASASARAAGTKAVAVRLTAERAYLDAVTLLARARLKLTLRTQFGRWRMSHAEIEALGRDCVDCARKAAVAEARMPIAVAE